MSNSDHPIDDLLIDRLVDNALDADQQQRVLAALDRESGGWRRLALAFVEAQVWRGSFRAWIQEPSGKSCQHGSPVSGPYPKHFHRHPTWSIVRPFALAAGLFMAFLFGLLWQGAEPATNPTPRPIGAMRTVDTNLPTRGPNGQDLPQSAPSIPGALPDDKMMLYVDGHDPVIGGVPVTLIKEPDIDSRIQPHIAPALPEPFRRRLEQLGYQVETERRYAPFVLQDGRHMYVPVDDTRIQPVRMPVY